MNPKPTEQEIMPHLVQEALQAQTAGMNVERVRAWDRNMTRAFKGIRGGRRVDRLRNLEATQRRMESE